MKNKKLLSDLKEIIKENSNIKKALKKIFIYNYFYLFFLLSYFLLFIGSILFIILAAIEGFKNDIAKKYLDIFAILFTVFFILTFCYSALLFKGREYFSKINKIFYDKNLLEKVYSNYYSKIKNLKMLII